MEGISKQYLKNSLVSINDAPIDDAIKSAFVILVEKLIAECQELQEPGMTLDEFLKNPKYEWCWIVLINKQIHMAYVSYNDSENYVFYLNDFDRDESYSLNEITHVMPIHKPEPPK